MALSDIEFVRVKEEYELRTEKTTEEDETLFSSRTAQTKCGEIHSMDSSNFILICMLCEGEYDNLMVFGKHYQNKHIAPKLSDILKFKHADPVMIEFPDDQHSLNQSLPSATVDTSTCSRNAPNKNIEICENQQSTLERPSEKEHIRARGKLKTPADEKQGTLYEFTSACKNSGSTSKSSESPDHNKKQAGDSLAFFCEICNRKFRYKKQFRRHGMYHETPPLALQLDADYLKCYYCRIEFTELRDWREHEEKHGKAPVFACLKCPQVFKREESLRTHMSTHNGLRPFKCEQCPLSFADIVNFKQHVKRIHLKIVPYECSFCNKKFATRTEVGLHKRTHTGEKPFQCEVCGNKYRFRSHMMDHRRKHDKLRDFKCNECTANFFTKSLLKKHMVKHSDERPFVCNVCGHTFNRKDALATHMKLHLDAKQYVCVCGKDFAQLAGLHSHRKSHENPITQ